MSGLSPPPTPPIERALLNLALGLSLEFGPNWLKPIQPRLQHERPDVTSAQADELDAFARGTRDWAHDLIGRSLGTGVPGETEARRMIVRSLPWIDDATFEHLWSQGVYYALK
jgi:hypothetical protein